MLIIRKIPLVLLLIFVKILVSQNTGVSSVEEDYNRFREVFNNELKNSDSSTVDRVVILHPAKLADWLSVIPASSKNYFYSLGISDPGMQKSLAFKQAVLRAKAMASLLMNADISSITDYYTSEHKHESESFITKYSNYYQLKAALISSNDQVEIVNEYYTSFDEAIVLLKLNLHKSEVEYVDSILVKIDVYMSERQLRNKFDIEEKYEVFGLTKPSELTNDLDIFYYSFNAVNQIIDINSRFNGTQISIPDKLFRYQAFNNNSQMKSMQWSSKLSFGLWTAYLQAIVDNFIAVLSDNYVNVSQIHDNYTVADKNLSREVNTASPSFRLQGLNVNNNKLSVYLNRVTN